mgnify:CR=1 FL=1
MSGHGIKGRWYVWVYYIVFEQALREMYMSVYYKNHNRSQRGLVALIKKSGRQQWRCVIVLALGSHVLCLIPTMSSQSDAHPPKYTHSYR